MRRLNESVPLAGRTKWGPLRETDGSPRVGLMFLSCDETVPEADIERVINDYRAGTAPCSTGPAPAGFIAGGDGGTP